MHGALATLAGALALALALLAGTAFAKPCDLTSCVVPSAASSSFCSEYAALLACAQGNCTDSVTLTGAAFVAEQRGCTAPSSTPEVASEAGVLFLRAAADGNVCLQVGSTTACVDKLALKAELVALEQRVTVAADALGLALSTRIANVSGAVAAVSQRLGVASAQVAALQLAELGQNATLHDTTQRVSLLEAGLGALGAGVARSNATLQASIEALQADLDARNGTLHAQIAALRADVERDYARQSQVYSKVAVDTLVEQRLTTKIKVVQDEIDVIVADLRDDILANVTKQLADQALQANGPFGRPDLTSFGGDWHKFWWFDKGSTWPSLSGDGADVLGMAYGTCSDGASYCFGRLPSSLKQDNTEMLAVDSAGTIYKYRFNSQNEVSSKIWGALHDHKQITQFCSGTDTFYPEVLAGTPPTRAQDCFQYRPEQGVVSFILDDDTCDCITSLSMGHGICGSGHSTAYAQTGVYGVDLLYDPACQAPLLSNGLTLYFRERKPNVPVQLTTFGGGWTAFWWWKPGQKWPCTDKASCPGADVLSQAWGECDQDAQFCLGRMPPAAQASDTELLAVDSRGEAYRWSFGVGGTCADDRAFAAFRDHQTTANGVCINSGPWNPTTVQGTSHATRQDSFMYRVENGVKSLLLDDDGCDCLSTLSMGHIMCGTSHSTSYGPANTFGVDLLYDPACNTPNPSKGLTLYLRSKTGRRFTIQ